MIAQQRKCASKLMSMIQLLQLITHSIEHRPTHGRRAQSHPWGTTSKDAGDVHQGMGSRAWMS